MSRRLSLISIVTKHPSLLRMSVISMMSAINLTLSPINLFLTYAVCCGEIKLGRTFLSLDAKALEIILQSTFNKEIGRQFLINFLSLSFFSISFMTACLCEVLYYFLSFPVRHEFKKASFISSQKLTKNSFVSS